MYLNIDRKKIAERSLKYRALHNLSQRDFAKKLGISNKTLSSIENADDKLVTELAYFKLDVKLKELEEK